MKFAVIADIHANLAALEAFFDGEEFKELVVLGDIVGYGPDPAESLGRIMGNFDIDVQGNHDYSLVSGAPIGCREEYRAIAESVMGWTRGQVSGEPLMYLEYMPKMAEYEADGRTYRMYHGTPSDPRHGYLDGDADEDDLLKEIESEEADTIIVAHSHIPFIRQVGSKLLVNPGSIGQPRDGVAEISYAIIDGGDAQIIRRPYDVERTLHGVSKMEVPDEVKNKLIHIYKTATDPA